MNRRSAVVQLLTAAVICGTSVGFASRAESFMYVSPGVGHAAGLGLKAPEFTAGLGGKLQ